MISQENTHMILLGVKIRKKAMEEGYKPLVIDGFNKILDGYTTLKELNSKLVIY